MRMNRLALFVVLVAVTGCGRPERTPDEILPVSPGEGWTRGEVRLMTPAEAPGIVRQLGLRRLMEAPYAGPGDVQATVYEMRSEVVAFELNQKWRAAGNTVHFQQGRYFAVAESANAGRPRLFAFAKLLEKHLASLP